MPRLVETISYFSPWAVHSTCRFCVMRLLSAWNVPIPDRQGRTISSECDVSDIYAYCLVSTASKIVTQLSRGTRWNS